MKINSTGWARKLILALLVFSGYAEWYSTKQIREYNKLCLLIRQFSDSDSGQREILSRKILMSAERLGERNMPRRMDDLINIIFIEYPTLSVK